MTQDVTAERRSQGKCFAVSCLTAFLSVTYCLSASRPHDDSERIKISYGWEAEPPAETFPFWGSLLDPDASKENQDKYKKEGFSVHVEREGGLLHVRRPKGTEPVGEGPHLFPILTSEPIVMSSGGPYAPVLVEVMSAKEVLDQLQGEMFDNGVTYTPITETVGGVERHFLGASPPALFALALSTADAPEFSNVKRWVAGLDPKAVLKNLNGAQLAKRFTGFLDIQIDFMDPACTEPHKWEDIKLVEIGNPCPSDQFMRPRI